MVSRWSWNQIEIDFGSTAIKETVFVVNDSYIQPNSRITIRQSADAPTGKSADENEMDLFHIQIVQYGVGFIRCALHSLTGWFRGPFKFKYEIEPYV